MPLRYQWPLFGQEALPDLTPEIFAIARRVFGAGSKYLGDEVELLGPGAPEPTWLELPVIGRSNVGKSSLLNALLGSADHTFVPVSRQPGSTRHLDFYSAGLTRLTPLAGAPGDSASQVLPAVNLGRLRKPPTPPRERPPPMTLAQRQETLVSGKSRPSGGGGGGLGGRNPSSFGGSGGQPSNAQPLQSPPPPGSGRLVHVPSDLIVVDTPGYGFNVRGKVAEEAWSRLLGEYLAARSLAVVARCALLVDARTGLQPLDLQAMRLLDELCVPYHLVLTKADAVSPLQLEAAAEAVARTAARHGMPFPVLHAVSARTGAGLAGLQAALVHSTRLHRRCSAAAAPRGD